MIRPRFILLLLLLNSVAEAGPLRLSAGYWDYEITGISVDNGVRRDLRDDLAVEPSGQLRLALEYDALFGGPLDFAASYSEFGGTGSAPVQGGVLRPGSFIETRGDFNDADLTLRWPLQLGPLRFSPGLSLKRLDGEFVIDDPAQAQVSRQAVDEIFPQIHGELHTGFGRFYANAVVQAIAADGQAANEVQLRAGVRVFGPLALQLGWQQKRYDLRQGASQLKATLSGLTVQAGIIF